MLAQQTEAEISEAALNERREAVRREKIGKSKQLSAYMARGGAIVAEDIPGVGTVYRTRERSGLIFDAETVARWIQRTAIKHARAEKRAAKQKADA